MSCIHVLHLVSAWAISAWASRQRLVLGQEAVAEKSNEIAAIPLLLERLELTGALVSTDAMGCRSAIAETIRVKGADYLLALKGNWPALVEEVRLLFARKPDSPGDAAKDAAKDTYETTEGDHGRIEVRRHRVSHDTAWIRANQSFPGRWHFPDLATIGMVEAEVERNGKTSVSRRYYLCSAVLTKEDFAAAVRAHWSVDNNLHWVMDVVFHDDLRRLRTQNGPANMAAIRHVSLNLFKAIPDKASLTVRRKTAAWDEDYLFAALTA